MNKVIMDDPNTFYLVNGLRRKTHEVKNNPDVLNYKVTDSEKGKSADELLQEALQKVHKPEDVRAGGKQTFLGKRIQSVLKTFSFGR